MIFCMTFFNYAVLHATRSIWSAATKDIEKNYGFEHTNIANMNSCFLVSYGLGNIFMGQLADKYSKKKLIPVLYALIALNVFVIGCLSFIPKDK